MMLTPYSKVITATGEALVAYLGEPNVAVRWEVVSGPGAMIPIGDGFTNEAGAAMARFVPGGFTGAATIRVTYGT